MLREWGQRLWGTLRPGRRDDELAEELRLHQELAAEAGRAARVNAGGASQAMDALRDQRGLPWIDTVMRDVRYGLRVLGRSPVFTAVAVASLALGIGANAAIVHLIDTVHFRPLAVERPHELAEVHAPGTDGFGINEGANGRVTHPLWEQIRTHQRAFSDMFAWGDTAFLVGRGRAARAAAGLWVSGDFFRVLGISAHRGRLLTVEDDRAGCGAGAAVVSYDFWQAALGGTDAAIGTTIVVLEHPFTIAGVTPPGFTGLEVGRRFDVALPLCSAALLGGRVDQRDRWWLTVMGRMKTDWTLERANEHMQALSPGILAATVPDGYSAELLDRYRSFRFGAFPASHGVSRLRDAHGTSLSLLLALTGLVLLITCGNLATLMVARATAREREMAVRAAIGASRRRLVLQMLIESLLVAVAGAAIAIPVALTGARSLVAFLDTTVNAVALPVSADWRLLVFVAATGALTTLLFGLLPALRVSLVDPTAATRLVSRGSTLDRHGAMFRRGLVIAQIALSLVLSVAAVMFVRSFRNLATVDLGFDVADMRVVSFVDLVGGALPVEQRVTFQQRLTEAIRSAPGVTAAASSSHFPLSGGTWAHFFKVPAVSGDETKVSRFVYVSPEFFDTLGVPLVAGRRFDEHDHAKSRRVLIVSENFVRSHLGGRNPIGATIRTVAEAGYPETTYEVVGVVRNTKYTDLRQEDCWCGAGLEAMPPIAYVPGAQDPAPYAWTNVIVRTQGPASAVTSAIQQRVEQLNPAIVVNVTDLQTQIGERLVIERTVAWLAGAFGGLAVVLVVVGLYGLIAYLAAGRRTEIGVRLSLGSTRAQVLGLVLRESVWLVAIGVAVGLPLAAAAMRGTDALLFGVPPIDALALAGATLLLAASAMLAGSIPAWRASRLDPVNVLRAD